MTRLGHRGFLLLELVVALTVTGLVLSVAAALLWAVRDAESRVMAASAAADAWGNRRAWLNRVFEGAVSGSTPARGFRGVTGWSDVGESDQLGFFAWVRTGGVVAVRRIRLWRTADGRVVAELALPPGRAAARPDTVILGEATTAFGADYLLDYGADARWVADWDSPVAVPLAARLRITYHDGVADTVLFHLGARG